MLVALWFAIRPPERRHNHAVYAYAELDEPCEWLSEIAPFCNDWLENCLIRTESKRERTLVYNLECCISGSLGYGGRIVDNTSV